MASQWLYAQDFHSGFIQLYTPFDAETRQESFSQTGQAKIMSLPEPH
jgi:hypothetical protein